jgi:uncharacterized protein
MISMKKERRRRQLIAALFLIWPGLACGQLESVENSLFWEVTREGMTHSSYLFGSHHLFGSQYVDSLSNVNRKFENATTFINEVRFDSADLHKMAAASVMRDSALDQLLSPEWFHETDLWLQELSDYESLWMFNRISPIVIQVLFLNLLQEQVYGKVDTPMDTYLEKKAIEQGKRVVGLESIEEQMESFLHAQTYRRQTEMLVELVRNRSTAIDELVRFNHLYRNQNLSALLESGLQKYLPEEVDRMLVARNKKWLETLPALLLEQSSFVVVGALHLAGENGLVNQLRKQGFIVTPISIY